MENAEDGGQRGSTMLTPARLGLVEVLQMQVQEQKPVAQEGAIGAAQLRVLGLQILARVARNADAKRA